MLILFGSAGPSVYQDITSAALYTVLEITTTAATGKRNVTKTANLVDGANYTLIDGGWAPRVPPRLINLLGGRGAYEEPEERLEVNVFGPTGALALANLAKLSQLLDQAEAWNAGDNVAPVYCRLQPQGSLMADPLRAVITGRGEASNLLEMPVSFNDKLMIYEIGPVSVNFERRPLWLLDAYSILDLLANSGFEVNTTGWSAVSPSVISRSDLQAYNGQYSMLIESGGVATQATALSSVMAITNQTYRLSAHMYNDDLPAAATLTLTVRWSGGAQATASTVLIVGVAADITGVWKRFSGVFTPDFADRTQAEALVGAATGVTAPGQGLFVDALMFKAGADDSNWHPPAGDTLTRSGISGPNPVVQSVTFLPAEVEGGAMQPVKVAIGGFTDTSHLNIFPSTLVVAAAAKDIHIAEAESMTATGYTSVADSANHARGGSVLRYTGSVTTERASGTLAISATDFNRDTEEVMILANVRNASGKSFKVVGQTFSYVANSGQDTEPFVVNGTDFTTPKLIALGTVSQKRGHKSFRLLVTALDATGSPLLDIDYVVFVAIKPTTYVVGLGEMFLSSPFVAASPSNVSIVVDPQPLTGHGPFVGYVESSAGNEADVSYEGDAALAIDGLSVAALWLATRGVHWVDTTAASVVTTVSLTVTRWLSYLTPQ